MTNYDFTAINDALQERMRAHEKHKNSDGGSMEMMDADRPGWLAILGEEVGEVSEEMLHLALAYKFGQVARASTYDQDSANRRKELVQVIAVAWAWINKLDEQAEFTTTLPDKDLSRLTYRKSPEQQRFDAINKRNQLNENGPLQKFGPVPSKLNTTNEPSLTGAKLSAQPIIYGKEVKSIFSGSEDLIKLTRLIERHHDRLHGFCIHGELAGDCNRGGYSGYFVE